MLTPEQAHAVREKLEQIHRLAERLDARPDPHYARLTSASQIATLAREALTVLDEAGQAQESQTREAYLAKVSAERERAREQLDKPQIGPDYRAPEPQGCPATTRHGERCSLAWPHESPHHYRGTNREVFWDDARTIHGRVTP